ncbi:hypothetical protein ACTXT7_011341 [Hymenolepis weldensis]
MLWCALEVQYRRYVISVSFPRHNSDVSTVVYRLITSLANHILSVLDNEVQWSVQSSSANRNPTKPNSVKPEENWATFSSGPNSEFEKAGLRIFPIMNQNVVFILRKTLIFDTAFSTESKENQYHPLRCRNRVHRIGNLKKDTTLIQKGLQISQKFRGYSLLHCQSNSPKWPIHPSSWPPSAH